MVDYMTCDLSLNFHSAPSQELKKASQEASLSFPREAFDNNTVASGPEMITPIGFFFQIAKSVEYSNGRSTFHSPNIT
jgi:hypothetical protein